eukprot:Hpha_TRINITY_DN8667_c0_g1::TRINITY_DN8667_c0_g1_i1::g.168861::m.168861
MDLLQAARAVDGDGDSVTIFAEVEPDGASICRVVPAGVDMADLLHAMYGLEMPASRGKGSAGGEGGEDEVRVTAGELSECIVPVEDAEQEEDHENEISSSAHSEADRQAHGYELEPSWSMDSTLPWSPSIDMDQQVHNSLERCYCRAKGWMPANNPKKTVLRRKGGYVRKDNRVRAPDDLMRQAPGPIRTRQQQKEEQMKFQRGVAGLPPAPPK